MSLEPVDAVVEIQKNHACMYTEDIQLELHIPCVPGMMWCTCR